MGCIFLSKCTFLLQNTVLQKKIERVLLGLIVKFTHTDLLENHECAKNTSRSFCSPMHLYYHQMILIRFCQKFGKRADNSIQRFFIVVHKCRFALHSGLVSRIIRGVDSVLLHVVKVMGSSM